VGDFTIIGRGGWTTTLHYGWHVDMQFGFVPTLYTGSRRRRRRRPLFVDHNRLPMFGPRAMAFRDRTGLDKRRAPAAASVDARRRHGFPAGIQLHRRLLQPLQHAFHVIFVVVAIVFTAVFVVVVIDYPRALRPTVHVRPPELQSFFFFGRFVVVRQQDVPYAAHPRGPNHQSSARRFPAEKLVRVRVGRLHNRGRSRHSAVPGTFRLVSARDAD